MEKVRKKERKEVPKKEMKEVRGKKGEEVRRKEMKELPKKEWEELRRKGRELEKIKKELREKELFHKAMKELRRKEMKEQMKELHKIAWVSYYAAPEFVRDKVREFFQRMAGDDIYHKMKFHEFVAFINKEEGLSFIKKEEGLSKMRNRKFFDDLIIAEGNDSLGFCEIVTLSYILFSRRPFCDGCTNFIKGTFFTCAKCFDRKSTSFNICISCFGEQKYKHEHKDQFFDNFLLLEMSRNPEFQFYKTMKSQPSAGTSYEGVPSNRNNPSTSQQARNSQSSAGTNNQLVVPYDPNKILGKGGILFSFVYGLVNTVNAVASLAGCSIM